MGPPGPPPDTFSARSISCDKCDMAEAYRRRRIIIITIIITMIQYNMQELYY
jgi:hypothetical protein